MLATVYERCFHDGNYHNLGICTGRRYDSYVGTRGIVQHYWKCAFSCQWTQLWYEHRTNGMADSGSKGVWHFGVQQQAKLQQWGLFVITPPLFQMPNFWLLLSFMLATHSEGASTYHQVSFHRLSCHDSAEDEFLVKAFPSWLIIAIFRTSLAWPLLNSVHNGLNNKCLSAFRLESETIASKFNRHPCRCWAACFQVFPSHLLPILAHMSWYLSLYFRFPALSKSPLGCALLLCMYSICYVVVTEEKGLQQVYVSLLVLATTPSHRNLHS